MTAGGDWSAYWRGRGGAGEAFAGEGVEQHPALAAHWDRVFAGPPTAVLDLACGAGSVLRRARAASWPDLTGADVSQDALSLLSRAVPGAKTVLCNADAVPLPDASFGLVTSQFGFEYAGDGAASEIARLVAPGGRVAALVHYAGGVIEREVAANAAAAAAVSATGFVPAATALTEAAFAARAGRSEARASALAGAKAGFAAPERALAEIARRAPGSIGAHLHQGFRRLWDRQAAYALGDVTGWLDGMAGELSAFEGRMATMRGAARDAAGIDAVVAALGRGGVRAEAAAFVIDGDPAPLAWRLTGVKSR